MTDMGDYRQSVARFLVSSKAGRTTRDQVAATLLEPALARALELDTGAPVADDELLLVRDMLETLQQRQRPAQAAPPVAADSGPGLYKRVTVAVAMPPDWERHRGTSFAAPLSTMRLRVRHMPGGGVHLERDTG